MNQPPRRPPAASQPAATTRPPSAARPVVRPRPSPSSGGRPPSRSIDPRLVLGGGGAVLLLLVLGLLFIGPWSILNPSDNNDQAVFSCPTIKAVPPPPDGLNVISDYKDFSEGKCNRTVPNGPSVVTMPLKEPKGARGLSFYTYTGDKWQRVAPAELTDDGKYARVVVDRVPTNGAILRRSADAFQVMGVVPQGQVLHPEAERLATVVGGIDFVPAADGALNGNLSNLKRGDGSLLVPVVRAPGGAEEQAVNALVAAADRREAHATNIGRLVQSNRLDGIELEYTAVDPARRADFTELVRVIAESVHRAGGILVLTLPLPIKDGNTWNTGAYDWAALAKLADYLKIAPERDQSVYRGRVPDALTYLSGVLDAKKLILTVSPLSAERTDQGIRLMSTLEALSIAAQFTVRDRDRAAANTDVTISADNLGQEGGAAGGLAWDAGSATVSFAYRSGDLPRTVWIENQFSAAFKMEFAQLWNLGGIAVDDASANEGLASIWPAVAPVVEKSSPPLQQPNSGLLRPQWQVNSRPFQEGRPVVTWRTPAEGGTHTVTLIVSDGQMRVSNTQRIALRAAAPGATATPAPSPSGSPRPGASPAATPIPTPRR